MFNYIRSRQAKKAMAAAVAVTMLFVVSGCGNKQQQQQSQATLVKSMQVIKRDTPIVFDFTGFVEAQQESDLKAQVNGQITGKFFKGGDTVQAGQVLYTIDARTYQANVLNAEAALASAEASMANAALNAERYTQLYQQNAVSKQILDNALTQRDQARAAVNAQRAILENAKINMSETNVTAPFTGRTDTTSLEVGNYVVAGQTPLVKISNTDPVLVKFSMAETEYIKLANEKSADAMDNLTIKLSDGSTYPFKGKITEINRGISDGTGSMTLKAMFQNPNKKLLPGMFAHVQATSGVQKDAILIPKRAVVELMYKTFVYVIDSENKVAMKEVKLGPGVDRMYVVESGLTGDENIVVEGTGKIRQGAEVKAQPMTEADLNTEASAADKNAAPKQ